MNLSLVRKRWSFLLAVLILQLLVIFLVVFDVPIARQAIGFAFYTFMPGFIIARLLGLKELGRLTTILFSVGFSVGFLMLSGLFVNEVALALGVSQPLSQLPLLIAQTILIILGSAIVSLRGKSSRLFGSSTISRPFGKSTAVLICLPVLSVVGALCVDVCKSNLAPLLGVLLVSVLFSAVVGGEKRLSPHISPLALFVLAISLLYGSSLVSRYVVSFGSDVPAEYYIQRITQNSGHWNSAFVGDMALGRLNAMLSVTILPTTYSALLKVDSTLIFKALFPMIFAFVPLCLYMFWESEVGSRGAFIAAFLFMAQMTFFTEMLGLQRQMIAELFFALLLLVAYSNKVEGWARSACFSVFGVGLVVSHYGLAEIFLFFIITTYVYTLIVKRQSRKVTLSMVVLFFVIMFSWYIYTSNATVFDSFVSFGNHVYSQLNQFLNPESRGQEVLRGLGLEAAPTIWNLVGRLFAYVTELLIAIGFVALIIKRTDSHFQREQFALSSVAVGLLAALVVVPGLANTLGIARFYHILLFSLAALLVVGLEFIVKLVFGRDQVRKLLTSVLLVGILVPYFLFQSGFVYELTGSQSYSLPLSKNRMSQSFLRWNMGYFDETEVVGALWLSKSADLATSKTYADASSVFGVLIDYGAIPSIYKETLSNVTVFPADSLVYLNKPNIIEETVVGFDFMWNTTDILPVLDSANSVYSNGECQVYKIG